MKSSTQARPLVPAGIVHLTPQAEGRFLVEVGRARRVTRMNLSHAEASQLLDLLGSALRGGGRAGDADAGR